MFIVVCPVAENWRSINIRCLNKRHSQQFFPVTILYSNYFDPHLYSEQEDIFPKLGTKENLRIPISSHISPSHDSASSK